MARPWAVGVAACSSEMDHDGIVRVCTACRPVWRLKGAVVRGQARGRDLGFPTANLGEAAWAGQSRLPRHGVYIGWAAISSRPGVAYKAMVSVGDNPSFGSDNSVTIVRTALRATDRTKTVDTCKCAGSVSVQ